jgi:peptide/nickel transport system substrate-binding protein
MKASPRSRRRRPDRQGHLRRAEALPLSALRRRPSPILQKAQFEADCLGAKAPECTEQNFNPIGTGPFRVTDFKVNDVVTLEANPNYRDPAKPAFATMTLQGRRRCAGAARAVMETGEFDYAWNLQLNPDAGPDGRRRQG